MKKIGLLLAVVLCVYGCASTPPKAAVPLNPFIDLATWNSSSREQVYDACLTALHMQGYSLVPMGTSRENGLIVTEPRGAHLLYSLQILAIKNSDTQVSLSVNVRLTSQAKSWIYKYDNVETNINNDVSKDLDALFAEISTTLGPPVSLRKNGMLE